MLIQITNKCFENCPHCMQRSNPDGEHMTFETFKQTMAFGQYLGLQDYILSGGEPTLHPDLVEFIKYMEEQFAKADNPVISYSRYVVCSNGMWLKDEDFKRRWLSVYPSVTKHFASGQVYTNRLYYKDYEFVKYHGRKGDYKKFGFLFDEEPLYCKDLGRATETEIGQRENAKSLYHCSCLNAALIANQMENKADFALFSNNMFNYKNSIRCHPLVDYRGDVHMSESWLCPSVGNVNTDDFQNIWQCMRQFVPCMRCKDAKKLLTDDSNRVQQAVEILGIKNVKEH